MDKDELLTAREVAELLRVARKHPYANPWLRGLALRVGGSEVKPTLRWRRSDVLLGWRAGRASTLVLAGERDNSF